MDKVRKRTSSDSESPIADKKRRNDNETNTQNSESFLSSGGEDKIAKFHARRNAIAKKPRIFVTLKKMIEIYKKKMSKVPGHTAESLETFPPLFAQDVLFLILQAISGNHSSYFPRWCNLKRASRIASLVVLVIDGVSYEDVKQNKDIFSYTNTNLPINIQMISPLTNDGSFEKEMFWVPLTESQGRNLLKQTSNCEEAPVVEKAVKINKFSECVPVDPVDKFDRRLLLFNVRDMVQAGIPLHGSKDGIYDYFIYTKETYEEVKPSSPIFAIDCEMCISTFGSELTRVAVVNEKCEVIMDYLVKPRNAIIDYATRFSGISSEMLNNVHTSLGDVQKMLKKLLPPDAILAGHAIHSDLKVLKMFHPYIIDTSNIYNLCQIRLKDSLKRLSKHFLKKDIQVDIRGHSPAEDAIATMELVLLKLRTGVHFGDLSVGCPVAQSFWQTPSSNLLNNKSNKVISDGKSFYFNTAVDLQYRSLFDAVQEQNISSVVIGKPKSLPEGIDGKTEVISADTDRKCVEMAEKRLSRNQFMWVKLDDSLKETQKLENIDYRKKKYEFLDNSISRIIHRCKPGSLFITLFSGREEKGVLQSAGAFVCIPGSVDFTEKNDGQQIDDHWEDDHNSTKDAV